jgi:hypothetical protein
MCAGAKVEQAKHMMKYDPSKENEKAVVKIYSKNRLLFYFFKYRNPMLSRGRDFDLQIFDLELVLKKIYTNTCESKNHFEMIFLIASLMSPETPGPECPDTKSGVSGHIPRVSG